MAVSYPNREDNAMMWMVYFKLRNGIAPCWRLFTSHDEACSYAVAMCKDWPGFEYKVLRAL